MKKQLKKLLCLSLSSVLVLGSVPSAVQAGEIPNVPPVEESMETEDVTAVAETESEIPASITEEDGSQPEEEGTSQAEEDGEPSEENADEEQSEAEESEAEESGIAVDEAHFPDEVFRNLITESFDTDSNGVLSDEEIRVAGYIDCYGKAVQSLEGIEYFTNLVRLSCANNSLTSLDVSKNDKLEYVYCSHNQLTELIVGENPSLREISCAYNQLTSLELSGLENLTSVECNNNALRNLDVSNTPSLEDVNCNNNQLTAIDVSNASSLRELVCENNSLTSLDLTTNPALELITCSDNQLTVLDLSSNPSLTTVICNDNRLTSLDVSGSSTLYTLECKNNQLTTLDLTNNTELGELKCDENRLSSLDLSNNEFLGSVTCNNNQLTELNVEKNSGLYSLECSGNQLTELELANNTSLRSLNCSNNQLTELILSGHPRMSDLYCENNQLVNLDVTGAAGIGYIYCSNNELVTLDLSLNYDLYEVECENNHLTSLYMCDGMWLLTSFNKNAQTYEIKVADDGTFDLNTLPGAFDVSRTYDWIGGVIDENTLTVDEGVTEVSYKYSIDDEGSNQALEVVLKIQEADHEHEYTSAITRQPTYTIDGITTYTCSICGDSYTNPIPHTGVENPVLISAENTRTGVMVTWSEVNGAAKYRLYYKTEGGSWKRVVETTETSYNVTGLTSGTKYIFTARCLDSNGAFNSSYDKAGITRTYVAPPVLTGVVKTAAGVKVNWNAVNGADGYRVFMRTAGQTWERCGDTTDTSIEVKDLEEGTKYYFTVRCINEKGKYLSLHDAIGISITYVDVPVLTSVANTTTGVTVKWQAVDGIAKYRVFYKTAGGSWTRGGDTTATSHTVTGLKSGTNYIFTVRCVDGAGSYCTSFDRTGKTLLYLSTPSVSAARAKKGVTVSWSKVTGATGYIVYRKTAGGSWARVKQITSGSTVRYTDTTGKKGTRYYYTIRAYRSGTYSYFKTAGASAIAG